LNQGEVSFPSGSLITNFPTYLLPEGEGSKGSSLKKRSLVEMKGRLILPQLGIDESPRTTGLPVFLIFFPLLVFSVKTRNSNIGLGRNFPRILQGFERK